MKKNLSFEYCINKIEEIVSRLELGDEALDASIKLYEEGVDLITNCKTMLKEAQQKTIVIDENLNRGQ